MKKVTLLHINTSIGEWQVKSPVSNSNIYCRPTVHTVTGNFSPGGKAAQNFLSCLLMADPTHLPSRSGNLVSPSEAHG